MVTFLITLVLVSLVLLGIALLKTYNHVPRKELKRQAQRGDEFAKTLHRVTSYGMSLDLFLWLIIGVSSAVLFVFLARNFPFLVAVLGCLSVIWFGYAWMPQSNVTRSARIIAKWVTPSINWLLDRMQPIFNRIAKFLQNHRPITVHTGLYSKEDLLELIDRQQVQVDNRITKEELRVAQYALTFGGKKVGEVMTPRSMMKSVSASEHIGPILMEELHKSGHSRFPVFEDKKEKFVGTLYLRDLIGTKTSGTVKNVMSKDVYYVNEQQSISGVLHAFITTHHHIFIVVNNFEEIVGIITLEDVLEQILGRKIVDEFDRYDDLRAVALLAAEKHKEDRDYPAE